MASWVEAVKAAVVRHVAQTGSTTFTRGAFIAAELDAIVAETGTTGLTPGQTLGREMQQLRDAGFLAFEKPGTYRWLGELPEVEPQSPSNAVLFHDESSLPDEPRARSFAFASVWLPKARRTIGEWIIYQNPDGYHAAARVRRVEADRDPRTARLVMVEGSYLEFGRVVPLSGGGVFERALFDAQARLDPALTTQPVRIISREEFDSIVDVALIDDESLLPRSDVGADHRFAEPTSEFGEPVDRETVLTNRKVRDRQFRKRVLDAYGSRCALTGMRLINGGGRAETEAAHIKSVEAGGPDATDNGIALSGTIHWMFDRGLISLSDRGDILLSRAINDRDSVERLILPDRRARFPLAPANRPHPEYLRWHRTECFHD